MSNLFFFSMHFCWIEWHGYLICFIFSLDLNKDGNYMLNFDPENSNDDAVVLFRGDKKESSDDNIPSTIKGLHLFFAWLY